MGFEYGTMNCVIFPITVKTFEEKCFHAVDAKYLAAPGIDFTLVSSKLWKNRLVKGFIAKEADGIYTDETLDYMNHFEEMNITIRSKKGSPAESYANEHGIPFEAE